MSAAVVVGSGPNGLAAAVRLAHAGLRVTVVEEAATLGGGTKSSEVTIPGLQHDECSAFHPLGVASPYFAALDLGRHGLRWRWPDLDLAHPLDDGRAGVATRDMARTAASVGVDARRWQMLFGPLVRNFRPLACDTLRPFPRLPRDLVTTTRFGARAMLPATVIAQFFRDDPAKALFVGASAHGFGRLDTPLSSAIGLMLGSAAHAVGWPVAEGGSVAIANALLAELSEHGGKTVTNTRVSSLMEAREIAGERPDVVILDTAPRDVLEIVGDALPAHVRRGLTRYRHGPAVFKVDLAIEGGIPWTNTDCHRAGTVHLGGSATEMAQAEAATARGVLHPRPFVLLGQQYLADPSRSTATANPVYAYAHVPHGYDGNATEAVLAQIERFAPGFRDQILAISTYDAASVEAHNRNYVGGDISGGANTAEQLLVRPRPTLNPYALGVPGVYLCSSATPPGGGVHGMSGFHAAELALAQMGQQGS